MRPGCTIEDLHENAAGEFPRVVRHSVFGFGGLGLDLHPGMGGTFAVELDAASDAQSHESDDVGTNHFLRSHIFIFWQD